MSPEPVPSVGLPIKEVTTAADVNLLAGLLSRSRRCAVDIETSGFDPRSDSIRAIGIGVGGTAYIIYNLKLDLTPLKKAFENPKLTVLCHNAKFEMRFLSHHLRWKFARVWDTYLVEKVLTGGLFQKCDLGATEQRRANVTREYSEGRGKKQMQLSFVQSHGLLDSEQLRYLADDVSHLEAVAAAQWAEVVAEGLEETVKLEMDLLPHLAEIESRGLFIDAEGWKGRIAEVQGRLREMEVRLDELLRPDPYQRVLADPRVQAPPQVNLNAPAQVKGALMALMPGVEIATTESKVLKQIRSMVKQEFGEDSQAYQALDLLISYKKLAKEDQAFGQVVLDKRDAKTGRIYPHFSQLGAEATGRMSASGPNVMQIPSRGEASVLRNFFIAPVGKQIITCDFSQIELRILAYLCRDESMVHAFNEGRDLHTSTASLMYGFDYERLNTLIKEADEGADSKEHKDARLYRSMAKTINFGLVYGMGAPGLSAKLTEDTGKDVSLDEAKALLTRYFDSYPAVGDWLQAKRLEAVQQLCSVTMGGRKRFFTQPQRGPDYNRQRGEIERQGANAVIQGTSADMTKRAVVLIQPTIERFGASVCNIVHDEIVTECPAQHADEVMEIVGSKMLEAAAFYLPNFPVEVGKKVGACWLK